MAEGAPGRSDVGLAVQSLAHLTYASPRAFDGLSPEQKRELATIVLAGIASALFFLVPLLGAVAPPPLPSSGVVVAMAVVVPPPRSEVPAAPVIHRRVARRLLPEPALATASLSTPVEVRPASGLEEREDGTEEEGKRTPGVLARVLFGNGRYRVQPFPTVEDRD